MNPLPSPYNFVPVTKRIYHPPWAGQVSHDIPFSDGICGTIAVTATATTPVFLRRGKDDPHFYRTHDNGPYAIPGSTLKGMARSVLEIASFGKLGRTVNKKRNVKYKNGKCIVVAEDIHSKIEATMLPHVSAWPPDLAETIFGFTEGDDALRGRVGFDPLIAADGVAPLPKRSLTLESSVGRCAPLYALPGPYDPEDGRLDLETHPFFDDSNFLIRGWKRYPAGRGPSNSDPPGRMPTLFHPLPANTVFSGKLRVHNLRPVELGAIIWALTWGGKGSHRHTLGLAKPFGYGCIRFEVEAKCSWLERIDGNSVNLGDCQSAYEKTMEDFMRGAQPEGWAGSESLRQLLAMADPASTPPMKLRYATAPELQAAKDTPQTLLPYLPIAGVRPRSEILIPPKSFEMPRKGDRVRCIVLSEFSIKKRQYVKCERDPEDRTRGTLNNPPPGLFAAGDILECDVRSDSIRSYAYQYLKRL